MCQINLTTLAVWKCLPRCQSATVQIVKTLRIGLIKPVREPTCQTEDAMMCRLDTIWTEVTRYYNETSNVANLRMFLDSATILWINFVKDCRIGEKTCSRTKSYVLKAFRQLITSNRGNLGSGSQYTLLVDTFVRSKISFQITIPISSKFKARCRTIIETIQL